MKVIFAGFCKTGTKTMAAALRELGYNVYDFMENIRFLGDEWMRVMVEGATVEYFQRMFEGVDAVTDLPCAFFWEELLQAFPDAKIIYRERISEDDWWKSMKTQLERNEEFLYRLGPCLSYTARKTQKISYAIGTCVFGFKCTSTLFHRMSFNEMLIRKVYRMHNSYVLEHAPKDQFLEIDFSQGWKPLCEFLGEPVPSTPFPHKNKNASINMELMKTDPTFRRAQIEIACLIVLILSIASYLGYMYNHLENTWDELMAFWCFESTFSYIKELVSRCMNPFGW